MFTAEEVAAFRAGAVGRRLGALAVDRGMPVGLRRGFPPGPADESVMKGGDCDVGCALALGRVDSNWRVSCLDIGNLAARGTVASLVLETPCWVSYTGVLCDMS